jgi:hypothetical protein
MLSVQLIKNAKHLAAEKDEKDDPLLPENQDAPLMCITLPSKSASDLSTPEIGSMTDKLVIRAITDSNGRTHYLVKYDVTKDPSGCSWTKKQSAESAT